MQGFYEYKLYGNNDELKKALETVKSLSVTDEGFKYLHKDCIGISEDIFSDKERKVLTFSMESSGNINNIPFDFYEMMCDLSKTFAHLEILGTGYNLDEESRPEWTSPAGSDDFDTEYKCYSYTLDEILEDVVDENDFAIVDENGDLIVDTKYISCEICYGDIEIKIDKEKVFDKKGKYLHPELEPKCNHCGTINIIDYM